MPPKKKKELPINKPFYCKWEFWILGVAVIALMLFQIYSNNKSSEKFEEVFSRLAEYEESHVPLEEIKVAIPSKKTHEDINRTFTAEIPFSYSGEKKASYFIDWTVVNSQGTTDNVAPLDNKGAPSVSYISEKDGEKTAEKNYTFFEADIYTITANFTYYAGSDKELGNSEEEIKDQMRKNNVSKSRKISFEVVVK